MLHPTLHGPVGCAGWAASLLMGESKAGMGSPATKFEVELVEQVYVFGVIPSQYPPGFVAAG